MNENLNAVLGDFSFEGGVLKDALSELDQLGLPDYFLTVFSELNGGEGFVG